MGSIYNSWNHKKRKLQKSIETIKILKETYKGEKEEEVPKPRMCLIS